MTHCPHCGAERPDGAASCPRCATPQLRVWPPPPQGSDVPAPPAPPRTLTGRAWADFALGAALQAVLHLATARTLVALGGDPSASPDDVARLLGPGFLALAEAFWASAFGGIGYYGVWRAYPWAARGSGWATLLLLAVLLGALFTCRAVLY